MKQEYTAPDSTVLFAFSGMLCASPEYGLPGQAGPDGNDIIIDNLY